MKKLAIAGASLALAAMPLVGVFADDVLTVKDKLVLTVSPSCTYDGITPAAATSEAGNEYTATTTSGGAVVSFQATSQATSLTVKCNDADGYTITPTFTGLSGPNSYNIPYRGTDPVVGTAGWTAYYSKNSAAPAAFSASGEDGAIEGTSTMTDTYSFSYKAAAGTDQAAGTYNGTASYVLAAK